MEKGSEHDGWATPHRSETSAETLGSAAGCRGRGGTEACPLTTGEKETTALCQCAATVNKQQQKQVYTHYETQ